MNNMMSMLPFLMSSMGGNKSGQGGMDMATMMKMFSGMGGGSPMGGQPQQPPQGGGMDMSAMMNMMNMMQGMNNKPNPAPAAETKAPPPPNNKQYSQQQYKYYQPTDPIRPMLPPEVLNMFEQMLNNKG